MAQLRMRRADLDHLPPVAMPAGYRLRLYQEGDEAAWAQIMNTGIGEEHTAASTRADLIERPAFRPEGLFFAETDGGEAVGSACAWRLTTLGDETGYVHMVCVRPEHRGHHLGYWLTLAVLHCCRAWGMRDAILETDDFRLSALRVYLELGFVPVLLPTHAERWQKLAPQLGITPPGE